MANSARRYVWPELTLPGASAVVTETLDKQQVSDLKWEILLLYKAGLIREKSSSSDLQTLKDFAGEVIQDLMILYTNTIMEDKSADKAHKCLTGIMELISKQAELNTIDETRELAYPDSLCPKMKITTLQLALLCNLPSELITALYNAGATKTESGKHLISQEWFNSDWNAVLLAALFTNSVTLHFFTEKNQDEVENAWKDLDRMWKLMEDDHRYPIYFGNSRFLLTNIDVATATIKLLIANKGIRDQLIKYRDASARLDQYYQRIAEQAYVYAELQVQEFCVGMKASFLSTVAQVEKIIKYCHTLYDSTINRHFIINQKTLKQSAFLGFGNDAEFYPLIKQNFIVLLQDTVVNELSRIKGKPEYARLCNYNLQEELFDPKHNELGVNTDSRSIVSAGAKK